eukprot:3313843-Rhodomonas_salina.1
MSGTDIACAAPRGTPEPSHSNASPERGSGQWGGSYPGHVPIALRASYAIPGTDEAYRATRAHGRVESPAVPGQ